MDRCKECGSWAINPHLHGRDPRADLDLCDVCYWRKRAESLAEEIKELRRDKAKMKDNVIRSSKC